MGLMLLSSVAQAAEYDSAKADKLLAILTAI